MDAQCPGDKAALHYSKHPPSSYIINVRQGETNRKSVEKFCHVEEKGWYQKMKSHSYSKREELMEGLKGKLRNVPL